MVESNCNDIKVPVVNTQVQGSRWTNTPCRNRVLNVHLHGLGLRTRQGIKPPLRRCSSWEKVDSTVVGSMQWERCSTGLIKNLPEVLVLHRNGGEMRGFSQARKKTSRARLRRLQTMHVVERAPTHDRIGSPVEQRIVPLEPRKPRVSEVIQ